MTVRASVALACTLALAGCDAPGSPDAPKPRAPAPAASTSSGAELEPTPCPPPPPLPVSIANAFDAAAEGRLADATRRLEVELAARPNDYVATVLAAAVEAESSGARDALADRYRAGRRVALAVTPPSPSFRDAPAGPTARLTPRRPRPTGELVMEDELAAQARPSPGRAFASDLPRELGGGTLFFASAAPAGRISVYASLRHRDFVLERPARPSLWLEIASGPDVTLTGMPSAAEVSSDGSLVVIQRARVGRPDDGALVALDAETGQVRWVSEPELSAVERFVVGATVAITARAGDGTGGTVSVVDLASGRALTQSQVGGYPRAVVARDGAVLVVGGDTTTEVAVDPSSLVARPSAPFAPPSPLGALDERTRCLVQHALAAAARRDAPAETAALRDLAHAAPEHRVVTALEKAAAHLADGLGPDGRVDLTAPTMRSIDLEAALGSPRAPDVSARLVKAYASSSTKDDSPWAKRLRFLDVGDPINPLSLLDGFGFASPPPELPLRFGVAPLARFYENPRPIARYGDRWLTITTERAAVASFELARPKRATWFDVPHAVEADGLLVVVYATEAGRPATANVAAIDVATGAVAWRASPRGWVEAVRIEPRVVLVALSHVAGSGSLAVYDRASGGLVAIAPLELAPHRLEVVDQDGKRYVALSGDGVQRVTMWVAELAVSALR